MDQQSLFTTQGGNYNGNNTINGFGIRSASNMQQHNSASNSLERLSGNRSRQQMGWLNDGMVGDFSMKSYFFKFFKGARVIQRTLQLSAKPWRTSSGPHWGNST